MVDWKTKFFSFYLDKTKEHNDTSVKDKKVVLSVTEKLKIVFPVDNKT